MYWHRTCGDFWLFRKGKPYETNHWQFCGRAFAVAATANRKPGPAGAQNRTRQAREHKAQPRVALRPNFRAALSNGSSATSADGTAINAALNSSSIQRSKKGRRK